MSTPRGWARPNPGKRSNILAHTPRPLAPEHGGKQDSEPDPSSPPSSRPSPNSLLFFAAKASPPLPEFPRANPIPDGAIGTVPHSNCPIYPTFGHRGAMDPLDSWANTSILWVLQQGRFPKPLRLKFSCGGVCKAATIPDGDLWAKRAFPRPWPVGSRSEGAAPTLGSNPLFCGRASGIRAPGDIPDIALGQRPQGADHPWEPTVSRNGGNGFQAIAHLGRVPGGAWEALGQKGRALVYICTLSPLLHLGPVLYFTFPTISPTALAAPIEPLAPQGLSALPETAPNLPCTRPKTLPPPAYCPRFLPLFPFVWPIPQIASTPRWKTPVPAHV